MGEKATELSFSWGEGKGGDEQGWIELSETGFGFNEDIVSILFWYGTHINCE